MKTYLRLFQLFLLLGVSATMAHAQITWGTVQHMSGTTDVSTTGTLVDAATFNSTAQTVNGVTFNPLSASGTIGGYTGYTDTTGKISANSPGNSPGVYGSTFSAASPSSAAYSAAVSTLAFGYYQNGTVVLSGLTSGHTYQVQVWSYYTGAGGSANTTLTGSNPVTLVPDAGEFVIGTFTASAASLTFNYDYGIYYGVLNAISVRDTTSGGSKPAITSPLTASGTVGTAFSYTVTGSNSPTSYSATPLPAGLTFNTTSGVISGTPTASGNTSITIGATNSYGTGTATLAVTIAAAGGSSQITWGTAQHMSGTTDVSTTGTLLDAATFNSTAQTVNGVTFNPLSSSGTIGGYTGYTDASTKISANSPGGSPGAYGTPFTTASPSSAAYSAANSTIGFGYYQNGTIVLSGLTTGHNYQVQVWSDYTGSPGNCNTTLTGANTVTLVPDAGEYAIGTFTAAATSLTFNYNYGASYAVISSLAVRDTTSGGSKPAITSPLTASGMVGTAFSYTITGSNSPTSYSATPLPAGLTFNTTSGVISGTPTASGNTSITIGATNSYGTGTATLAVTIAAAGGSSQITWGTAQHMSGTMDVSTTGTLLDAATFNSTAQTVNGVTFNPLSSSGTIGGYTGYTDASTKISANSPGGSPGAYGTPFTTASPSSAAYSAANSTIGFGYYQNGTIVLSGLTTGHNYQVQVWSDYTGSPGNCNTTLTGANTVTLVPDAGEYAIGTFTAAATSLTFNYNYGASYAVISSLAVRDTTSGGTTYALAVNSGTGSGNYAAGTVVTVTANTPPAGQQFAGWTGNTGALANPAAASTTLTMPASATSITATYSSAPTYALTVNSGSGSGNYAAGTVVSVVANTPPNGQQFAGWTGNTSALANPSAASTTLTMPAAATSITATYSQTGGTTYALTVTNGSGSGNYAAGTVITITAATAPSGYQFSKWTQNYGDAGVLANPSATTTTYTIASAAATVTATYVPVGGTTYALTVNGGSGSGNYVAGTIVTVTANAAPGGSQFARWLGTNPVLVLANSDSSSTTITVPSAATTITASYTPVLATYAVTVNGGVINNDTGSGSYPAGTILSVTANTPANGTHFTGWTGSTSALANSSFATTTLTVPAAAVSITAGTATTTSTYTLTVNSGTGSGTYAPGTPVAVTASAPATGMQFAGWTGSTSNLSNAAAPSTTFNVGSAAASITANYTAISSGGTLILAVGLEKIVSGYAGPLIRIQRPSDNTQMDIYAASGTNLLNTSTVSTFLGQSQGWITTLYAQDGSGHNVTTPLPLSTATMPTISVTDPTSVTINGTTNLTARNVEEPFSGLPGNARYFVIPPSVSINESQASAFLALRPDFSGSGEGDPFMSLYEVGYLPPPPGNGSTAAYPATADAFDLISTGGGLQGLTHVVFTTTGGVTTNNPSPPAEGFSSTNIAERSQQTVIGLVTAPGAAPLLYLDGVSHSTGGTAPASTNCQGGYLMAGVGTGYFYGIPLFATYNFLGFSLYSGTVSSSTAASISSTMLPRTVPAYNIVASGDSITQGTGATDGYNMLHFVEPLLNHPTDITNTAVEGSVTAGALGDVSYPTVSTSLVGMSYKSTYTTNIYYLASGTNDLHEGSTGAAAWSNDMQALQDAKSLGFKTVVATILHEYGETAAQSTEVDNFNALARAAVGSSYLDAVVDYEADVRLGNTGIYYPAYSGDGIHPNEAGYRVMSTIAAPVFNSLTGP